MHGLEEPGIAWLKRQRAPAPPLKTIMWDPVVNPEGKWGRLCAQRVSPTALLHVALPMQDEARATRRGPQAQPPRCRHAHHVAADGRKRVVYCLLGAQFFSSAAVVNAWNLRGITIEQVGDSLGHGVRRALSCGRRLLRAATDSKHRQPRPASELANRIVCILHNAWNVCATTKVVSSSQNTLLRNRLLRQTDPERQADSPGAEPCTAMYYRS